MAKIELMMPKMGESVAEATLVKWCKNIGDRIEMDETIIEIATDKVDSEVPSPYAGILVERLFKEEEVVLVGSAYGVIETSVQMLGDNPSAPDGDNFNLSTSNESQNLEIESNLVEGSLGNIPMPGMDAFHSTTKNTEKSSFDTGFKNANDPEIKSSENRFYSPLVRQIAKSEGVTNAQLDLIQGTGLEGRVTKNDILSYIDSHRNGSTNHIPAPSIALKRSDAKSSEEKYSVADHTIHPEIGSSSKPVTVAGVDPENDEIVEMSRMRRLIAEHMIHSKKTSAHVTSFVEADVTGLVRWRERIKHDFKIREKENITYTPIFIEIVAKALRSFPMINVSVNGNSIILHKRINIGMATALPNGNLIVPVIKDADQLSLVGITKKVNDLAARARIGKLIPEDTQAGTFTITNVGGFGNLMGTPIINQPQVAILATGAIVKKPAVLETPEGDVIAIRHKLFLSLSYDHRVVDGALGGSFLRKVADELESFDVNRIL